MPRYLRSYSPGGNVSTRLGSISSSAAVSLLHYTILHFRLNTSIFRAHEAVKTEDLLLTRPSRAQFLMLTPPRPPTKLFERESRNAAFVAGVRTRLAGVSIGVACATVCAVE
jgi:hypothetical protein